jgi:HAD superfamily phosphoserine phosphatase-like hydrolase
MIIFSDFDGTIAYNDLFDQLTDYCISSDFRIEMESKIINGLLNYNDVLQIFLEKFNISFDKAIEVINNKNNIVIDPYFKDFYLKCISNNINFYIISSGIKKIIKYYLPYVNTDIIIANDVIINNDKWDLELYNNKGIYKLDFVNNKSDDYKIYIGDGLSDISVVDSVDVLYVKENSYLHNYCIKNNKNHIPFKNFKDIYNII